MTNAGLPLREDLPESIRGGSFTLINTVTRRFARNVGDKNRLIEECDGKTNLILVWTGNWGSDAFDISPSKALELMHNK